MPNWSPASAWSNIFGSPFLHRPLSTRPVTTVPRPEIAYECSMGKKNGLFTSLTGTIAFLPISGLLSSKAARAEPLINGTLSASISTNSIISLSAASALLMKTTIFSIPICLAKRKCSLVCGITPSVAATTRMAPSI
ncbi:hypothetical protein BpHYR1_037948 [Brachionus plicatilis]|uniref:Uncharacterized protein n=1 Tax=Brachionus plicatilis TaxID=10195 RepID=A0A3M7QDC3_BRAPC|nr:hypothetical protein BpHYR1_037948 [Brachionus plicatilis]